MNNFSMADLSNVLASSGQSLYALRILRSNGMSEKNLQTIFCASVIAKLTYASPAWWGFANADVRGRIQAFIRRSIKAGLSARVTCRASKNYARSRTINCLEAWPLLPLILCTYFSRPKYLDQADSENAPTVISFRKRLTVWMKKILLWELCSKTYTEQIEHVYRHIISSFKEY